jgi:DNA adenine methylase
MSDVLRAPFPWFGGKRRVAPLVWERFGDVRNYVEPFAGSLAVLLARPHAPAVETVNDRDAYLSNFWRAVQADPDAVAAHADHPVNEADLHARHRWLVESGRERVERLMTDPDFFDAKVAGWWVWGQCLWIGSGWCTNPEWTGRANAGRRSRGVHAARASDWRKRPAIASGNGQGSGVHRVSLARQVRDLSGDSGAVGRGIHASGFALRTGGLFDYMRALQERLRRVRVCCGDWSRVLGPAVTTCIGVTGVFLDPPYSHAERTIVYGEDHDVSADVRAWAIDNGDNPLAAHRALRLRGRARDAGIWACVPWKAHGGYGRATRGKANAERERIWFSPACLSGAGADQPDLDFTEVPA